MGEKGKETCLIKMDKFNKNSRSYRCILPFIQGKIDKENRRLEETDLNIKTSENAEEIEAYTASQFLMETSFNESIVNPKEVVNSTICNKQDECVLLDISSSFPLTDCSNSTQKITNFDTSGSFTYTFIGNGGEKTDRENKNSGDIVNCDEGGGDLNEIHSKIIIEKQIIEYNKIIPSEFINNKTKNFQVYDETEVQSHDMSEEQLQGTTDEKLRVTTEKKLQMTTKEETQGTSVEQIQETSEEEIQGTSGEEIQIIPEEEMMEETFEERDINVTEETMEVERKGRPKKGRKRRFTDQSRESRRLRCQTNQKYISQKGKVVKPREFVDYHCKDKCHEKVTLIERQNEFKKFWNLDNFSAKCLYVTSSVKVIPVKRKRSKNSTKISYTRIYQLAGKEVCSKIFIGTLNISSARIDRYLKKIASQNVIKDNRGKGSNCKKLSDERKRKVMEHIEKFPKYHSHYCRNNTSRQFLNSETTLEVMYNLYKSENQEPVSFSTYKRIFYDEFNLQRKKPKKDTCNKCDNLNIKIRDCKSLDEKIKLENERDIHHKEAEAARSLMNSDLERARSTETLEVLTFDLEKTLPLPRIPTNIVYYKRQLWLYNCGVHSGKTGQGFCYVWIEGTAGKGAQEVGSVLRMHLRENLGSEVKELLLWSDSCGGQNRNIKIVMLLMAIMEEIPTIEKITMRFLVSGHSFMPNDSEFGDFESALKCQKRLYTPDDYLEVMKNCRKRNKLKTCILEKHDFVGVGKILKNIVNRTKDINGEAINWLKTREISFLKEKPFTIFFSTAHQGNTQEVDISKKQISRRACPSNFSFSSTLEVLWPEGKPVSAPKLKDIKFLLDLIPSDAKRFYENIIGDDRVSDDIAGFDGSLDFDPEDD